MTGWSPSELDCLSATRVMAYAKECLDRESADLMNQLDLFSVPAESFFGGDKHPARTALIARVRALIGLPAIAIDEGDEDQSREEMDVIRQINAAIAAGDDAKAARIEADWNARVEQRKSQGAVSSRRNRVGKIEGDLGLLQKAHLQGVI